jgi:two-component system, LytTR family, sensor kinase
MDTDTPVIVDMRRARFWLIASGIATLLGLLSFSYHYADVFARGETQPVHIKLVEELTGAFSLLLVLPAIVLVARRLRPVPRPIAIPLHVVVAIALSVVETSWNWASRTGLYALFGYGPYDYGIMRIRYVMEAPNYVVWYTVIASLIVLTDSYAAARARELRVAQLEGENARLKLQSLEAQLQPHFLFNALNTVSSVMYDDVGAADTILARLGDLLRRTLKRQGVAEVSLAEEVETLRLYCDIQRARFADRLEVVVDVDDEAMHALVPQLLLQPLVENAFKHGDPGPGTTAKIRVRARRHEATLRVDVDDNGPGVAPDADTTVGVGLENSRRRLAQLYGRAQSLSLGRSEAGGLRVTIVMPWHAAAPADGSVARNGQGTAA